MVAVAGLINHVAAVPLESRRENLEKYVLAQFSDELTKGDFDDIRRSAAITQDASIRANDFLIAMTLRLGYLKAVRPSTQNSWAVRVHIIVLANNGLML